MHINRRDRNRSTLYHRLFVRSRPLPKRGSGLFCVIWTVILSDIRLNFGSMRQNLDGPTTPHMLKRSTCGFIIAKPRRARQVQNLPHTSESAADFPMTDEGGSPLERDVSADKTDQNKPVPFWQVTLPRRARRIPGPGGAGVKFVASSARAGGHLMWPPCEPGL